MIIALVPARSGSKRIKDKNILRIGKKPLMINSLEICKKSKIFDKIHLSTDSKKYSKIARTLLSGRGRGKYTQVIGNFYKHQSFK